MVDYEKEFGKAEYQEGGLTRSTALAKTFKLVYGWMAAGLALSGVIAWYAATSGLCERILLGNGMTICIFAELALVFVLGLAIAKLPVFVAYLMFIAYAALNGLTLSVIFLAYDLASIQRVFFITAGMFGGLALWGTFTKDNLSSVGSFCGMALWGLIIACLVNMFMQSSTLDYICSIAGILIFTGLTMYDAQKVKHIAAQEGALDSATVNRIGIIGALNLYLDFINLFLYILRFFGRRR